MRLAACVGHLQAVRELDNYSQDCSARQEFVLLVDEHEVHDLATAQILDAEDFKEIGVKVGTRKKLLERLASSTSEA